MPNVPFDASLSQADTPEFFQQYGFAVFRNVFTKEEVERLRKQAIKLIDSPVAYEGDWNDRPLIHSLRADLFNRYPDFRWAFYKPEVQNALRKILGTEIGFVPESVLHYAGYGGWHKDTTSQERDGELVHYEPGCTMVECGIYLQDNHEIYGGGLDIVPGTQHQTKDYFVETKSKSLLQRVVRKIQRDRVQADNTKNCYRIPSKAGDFVFFNKRANHRGTPNKNVAATPEENKKYAIFFIGGKQFKHLEKYTKYIKGRYEYMKTYKMDPVFFAESKERGIHLVDPDKV